MPLQNPENESSSQMIGTIGSNNWNLKYGGSVLELGLNWDGGGGGPNYKKLVSYNWDPTVGAYPAASRGKPVELLRMV